MSVATCKELIAEAKALLAQLDSVIDAMDDTMYVLPLPLLSNTSIGAHVRHTLEFFECFQQGLSSGEVNYDLRRRDLSLENSRSHAMKCISKISQSFVFPVKPELALVRQDIRGDHRKMRSSAERELFYTIEHAVHHLAIIKIGVLQQNPNYKFPDHFGVASSTVLYQQKSTR